MMPPKAQVGTTPRPQHARKPSTANTGAGSEKAKKAKEADEAKKMPPPPPKPMAILEPELRALEDSLKNVTVSTAQIFKFHADVRRLGVQRHVPHPPRTMTLSLEHELRRYDQICDTLDSHLNLAVAVLQRDLEREEEKVREAEAEKARAKAAETPQVNPDIEMAPPSEAPPSDIHSTPPSGAITGAGRAPLRRPSRNFSLSTLHRNPFPLKLDLSSSALRLDTDEGGLDMGSLGDLSSLGNIGSLAGISGLASPVTLAPKSARAMDPGEIPPEMLAALASAPPNPQDMQATQRPVPSSSSNVDIDLTLDDHLPLPAGIDLLSAGSSADKPIELDLDLDVTMSELTSGVFGQQNSGTGADTDADIESLFSPIAGQSNELPVDGSTEGMDMSILNALSGNQNQSETEAFLASLGAQEGAPQTSADEAVSEAVAGGSGGGDPSAHTDFDFDSLDMSNVNMNDLFGSAVSEEPGAQSMEDLQKLLGIDQNASEAGPSGSNLVEDQSRTQPQEGSGSGSTA